MVEEELAQISAGEFENVWGLLLSSVQVQAAFVIMAAGIIGIAAAYRKFSSWVTSRPFYYRRPHASRFLRRAALPFFAIALITTINVYIQTGLGGDGESDALARETLAKMLNTFNILVIGYTMAHLIPILLNKVEKRALEEADFDAWFEMRGFADDDGDLFHTLYRWVPPTTAPPELGEERFAELLKTDKGRAFMEGFRTAKGTPIGSYEKIRKDPFEAWKESERAKYKRYYDDCTTGNNQSGRKLRPDARPPRYTP